MQEPKNILVIRNDKLGDFMLAYAAFNVVRKIFPSAKIYALVPEYTKPMAELCPWIDEIIIDDTTEGISGLKQTISKLKKFNIDAALCFHSSLRIALSLFLAQIPHRFAPASRLDQIFYNHRLTQRRSRSEKPEFEYNVDMANFMGNYYLLPSVASDEPPYLKLSSQAIHKYKHEISDKHQLDNNKKIVIVHPGSGGSAINLTIEQYADLIRNLSKNKSLFFIITAGPGEEKVASQLSKLLENIDHTIYFSREGLEIFSQRLAMADLFISGSTGVLHIAGALNVPTAAFYPQRQSATSLRWQTLNSNSCRLSFELEKKNHEDAPSIDVKLITETINDKYFSQL